MVILHCKKAAAASFLPLESKNYHPMAQAQERQSGGRRFMRERLAVKLS